MVDQWGEAERLQESCSKSSEQVNRLGFPWMTGDSRPRVILDFYLRFRACNKFPVIGLRPWAEQSEQRASSAVATMLLADPVFVLSASTVRVAGLDASCSQCGQDRTRRNIDLVTNAGE